MWTGLCFLLRQVWYFFTRSNATKRQVNSCQVNVNGIWKCRGNTAEAPGSLSPNTTTYRSLTYNAGTWAGSVLVCSSCVGQTGRCSLSACPSLNQSLLSCLNSTDLRTHTWSPVRHKQALEKAEKTEDLWLVRLCERIEMDQQEFPAVSCSWCWCPVTISSVFTS